LLEILWAYSMKTSAGFSRLMPSVLTVTAMIASFLLLSASMRTLPLGTAYAVWTGIGVIGTFTVGVLVLNETANAERLVGAALIICGLVLIRFTAA
jgi:quaternary ammonium compound-resistance protein SugE